MAINDWPKYERPREKLIHQGASALSDAELLAIFLRTGLPGKSAVELARDLLNDFGSLSALLAADIHQFCHAAGLGPAKFAQLQAVIEMSGRYFNEVLQQAPVLDSPDITERYLKNHLRSYNHEVFCCLFLDNRHRVIKLEDMFHGTIDGASVYPREVVRRAIHHNAAAIIFAHNHPSGVAEPSQADIQITEKLKQALSLIDIRVLDHFIIGEGKPVSMSTRGLI